MPLRTTTRRRGGSRTAASKWSSATRRLPLAKNSSPAPQPATSSLEGHTGMNIIIWLVVGGLVGWVASKVMNTDAQQGIVLNVVVGIVGALLGGWFLSPM